MVSFTKYFSILQCVPVNLNLLQSYQNCLFDSLKNKYNVYVNIGNNDKLIYLSLTEYDNNGLFGTNIFANSKIIGNILLEKNNNKKKLYIDNYFISFDHENTINKFNEKELKRILFGFAENIARDNNFNKICLDVNSNLINYKRNNLEELNFLLTEKKSTRNSFFPVIVTEKNLYPET